MPFCWSAGTGRRSDFAGGRLYAVSAAQFPLGDADHCTRAHSKRSARTMRRCALPDPGGYPGESALSLRRDTPAAPLPDARGVFRDMLVRSTRTAYYRERKTSGLVAPGASDLGPVIGQAITRLYGELGPPVFLFG